MGIAIQELLSQDYFKDFYVLAGAKGLHREIQGITVMEAPDAFHWTKGKELVLSSGYVIWRRYRRRYWSFLISMRCPLSPCRFQHHGWK